MIRKHGRHAGRLQGYPRCVSATGTMLASYSVPCKLQAQNMECLSNSSPELHTCVHTCNAHLGTLNNKLPISGRMFGGHMLQPQDHFHAHAAAGRARFDYHRTHLHRSVPADHCYSNRAQYKVHHSGHMCAMHALLYSSPRNNDPHPLILLTSTSAVHGPPLLRQLKFSRQFRTIL